MEVRLTYCDLESWKIVRTASSRKLELALQSSRKTVKCIPKRSQWRSFRYCWLVFIEDFWWVACISFRISHQLNRCQQRSTSTPMVFRKDIKHHWDGQKTSKCRETLHVYMQALYILLRSYSCASFYHLQERNCSVCLTSYIFLILYPRLVPTRQSSSMSNIEKNYMGLRGRPLSLAVSVVATTGFLLFGYDQGVMSGIISARPFNEYFPDTAGDDEQASVYRGFVTAIYEVGCLLGAAGILWGGDSLGRRKSVRLCENHLSEHASWLV